MVNMVYVLDKERLGFDLEHARPTKAGIAVATDTPICFRMNNGKMYFVGIKRINPPKSDESPFALSGGFTDKPKKGPLEKSYMGAIRELFEEMHAYLELGPYNDRGAFGETAEAVTSGQVSFVSRPGVKVPATFVQAPVCPTSFEEKTVTGERVKFTWPHYLLLDEGNLLNAGIVIKGPDDIKKFFKRDKKKVEEEKDVKEEENEVKEILVYEMNELKRGVVTIGHHWTIIEKMMDVLKSDYTDELFRTRPVTVVVSRPEVKPLPPDPPDPYEKLSSARDGEVLTFGVKEGRLAASRAPLVEVPERGKRKGRPFRVNGLSNEEIAGRVSELVSELESEIREEYHDFEKDGAGNYRRKVFPFGGSAVFRVKVRKGAKYLVPVAVGGNAWPKADLSELAYNGTVHESYLKDDPRNNFVYTLKKRSDEKFWNEEKALPYFEKRDGIEAAQRSLDDFEFFGKIESGRLKVPLLNFYSRSYKAVFDYVNSKCGEYSRNSPKHRKPGRKVDIHRDFCGKFNLRLLTEDGGKTFGVYTKYNRDL